MSGLDVRPALFDAPAPMPGQLGLETETGGVLTGEWHHGKRCSWCGTVTDCVAVWEDNGATEDLFWTCEACDDD